MPQPNARTNEHYKSNKHLIKALTPVIRKEYSPYTALFLRATVVADEVSGAEAEAVVVVVGALVVATVGVDADVTNAPPGTPVPPPAPGVCACDDEAATVGSVKV